MFALSNAACLRAKRQVGERYSVRIGQRDACERSFRANGPVSLRFHIGDIEKQTNEKEHLHVVTWY